MTVLRLVWRVAVAQKRPGFPLVYPRCTHCNVSNSVYDSLNNSDVSKAEALRARLNKN